MQCFMGKALYYVKPALRVSPYFQVLALFKSFRRRLHLLYSNKSCKQLSVVSNTHQLQKSSLNLLSCLCDDCHKQAVLISESRVDLNQCTSYRKKPDQHATCIPRSARVWSQTIRISRGQRIASFRGSSTYLDGSHCS
jgi:hypothetical protein